MSDYYDLADSVRSKDDLAREHARYGDDEIEPLNTVALICMIAGFALLWWVIR